MTTTLIKKTLIHVISMKFLRLNHRPLSRETSHTTRNREQWLYSGYQKSEYSDKVRHILLTNHSLAFHPPSQQFSHSPFQAC